MSSNKKIRSGCLICCYISIFIWCYLKGTQQVLSFFLISLMGVLFFVLDFGFAKAFRLLWFKQKSYYLRLQMLVIFSSLFSFGVVLFFSKNSTNLDDFHRHVHPITSNLCLGSFLFGIGMQLADGCGSGTCTNVGEGRVHGFVSLLFFILGSTVVAGTFEYWEAINYEFLRSIDLIDVVGVVAAVVLQSGVLAGIYCWGKTLELHVYGHVQEIGFGKRWSQQPLEEEEAEQVERLELQESPNAYRTNLSGIGAISLGVLNTAFLALVGRPWGITSALALWGSKAMHLAGEDVTHWRYWTLSRERVEELREPLYDNLETITNLALILSTGVCCSLRALHHESKVEVRREWRLQVGAGVGGFLMGIGARIAFGCNIGGYLNGVVSFSVHGWIWFLCAVAGMSCGVYLRA